MSDGLETLSRAVQCSASVVLAGPVHQRPEHVTARRLAVAALRGEELSGDPEMVAAAQFLASRVLPQSDLMVDAEITIGDGYDVRANILAYAVHRPSRTLKMWEFDYGHRLLDPHGSYDLALRVEALRRLHNLGDDWWATVYMVQPRCYMHSPNVPMGSHDRHVVWWSIDFAATLPDMMARLSTALKAARTKPIAATGDLCAMCPAGRRCEALMRAAELAVEMTGSKLPLELDERALAHELRVLRTAQDRLKARVIALEAQATYELRAGKALPGWTLQEGRGRREWAVPAEVAGPIVGAFGVDPYKPRELITPTQAIRAGAPEDIVKSLSAHEPGKTSLVEVTETAIRKAMK